MPKLPLPPEPARLRALGLDLVDLTPDDTVWRIHQLLGVHPARWDSLRQFGPLSSARFDPQDPPPRDQARGVAYVAGDIPTALAEVYQETRVVQPTLGGAQLTAWSPTRALRVLDLTAVWPLKAGASHALNSGRKDYTRAWARAICAAWPDLDGLAYVGMTGSRCWALYSPAADAFPAAPGFSYPLSSPGLRRALVAAADQIGYVLV